MAVDFYNLSNSLKEYLIAVNSEKESASNLGKAMFYKYNNLKIYMDKKKTKIPHFIVKYGISEAMFTINGCSKLHGGLGSDEKYVMRWHEKPHIEAELKRKWAESQKVEAVQMKLDSD